LSIVVVAFTTEITFGGSDDLLAATVICYSNGAAEKSSTRICINGVAATISSILISMMLLTFDAIIPCVDKRVKCSCITHVHTYTTYITRGFLELQYTLLHFIPVTWIHHETGSNASLFIVIKILQQVINGH